MPCLGWAVAEITLFGRVSRHGLAPQHPCPTCTAAMAASLAPQMLYVWLRLCDPWAPVWSRCCFLFAFMSGYPPESSLLEMSFNSPVHSGMRRSRSTVFARAQRDIHRPPLSPEEAGDIAQVRSTSLSHCAMQRLCSFHEARTDNVHKHWRRHVAYLRRLPDATKASTSSHWQV